MKSILLLMLLFSVVWAPAQDSRDKEQRSRGIFKTKEAADRAKASPLRVTAIVSEVLVHSDEINVDASGNVTLPVQGIFFSPDHRRGEPFLLSVVLSPDDSDAEFVKKVTTEVQKAATDRGYSLASASCLFLVRLQRGQ